MLFHHTKYYCLLAIYLVLASTFVSGQAPKCPFPNHTLYTTGSIKPNKWSQSQLDSSVVAFYNAWKKHYIRKTSIGTYYLYCNADGNWRGGNKSPQSVSLSEGHGYGMIIMATMAGYDTAAQYIFNGMLRYFKDHPSSINHHLMAWNQEKDTARTERNSDDATDGDLDIGYALLLADRQWGSNGAYNYLKEAQAVINALMLTNVNPKTKLMMMGDFTEKGEAFYYDTRPSDIMPDHFKVFFSATRDSEWIKVSDKSYALLASLQKKYSPAAGLFPDFARIGKKGPRPAGPFFMEVRQDGDYWYNACRIPLRLACDYLVNGDKRAKNLLSPMNQWIMTKSKGDPNRIRDGYTLEGKYTVGASGDNIAFIGTFGLGAMTDATNQAWLNRIWDYAIKEPLSDEEYYGNTLKMICMLVMSGNWTGIPATK